MAGTGASAVVFLHLWCCWGLRERGTTTEFPLVHCLDTHWLWKPGGDGWVLTGILSHGTHFLCPVLQALASPHSGMVVARKVEVVVSVCLLSKHGQEGLVVSFLSTSTSRNAFLLTAFSFIVKCMEECCLLRWRWNSIREWSLWDHTANTSST